MSFLVLAIAFIGIVVSSSELWLGTALTYKNANVSISATPVHNLNTNMSYSTIQAAINDSATLNGHVIFVENGTYNEHLSVYKSLTLKGESKENTTVLWEGSEHTVEVTASYVSVSGFKVQKSNNMSIGNASVMFNGGIGDSLANCSVQYGYYGIILWGSYECTVSNVTVSDSGTGLLVYDSGRSVVSGNKIIGAGFGLAVSNSTGCTLRDNRMINCSGGFGEGGLAVEHFFNDIDISNSIDGKPVYCLMNHTGLNVNPSTYPNVGSLTVANSTGVTVENLTLSHSGLALVFAFTNDSIIRNVVIANNTGGNGVIVSSGINNTVSECNVSDCFSGVMLSSSMNNTVRGNVISNSDHFGVYLYNASLNTIVGNDVLDSDWTCAYMTGSDDNTIYHNNFVNYSEAYVDSHPNVWDDGVEGNYWSTYTGVDLNLDGIGDTSYILSAYDVDHYPLMGMYHSYDVGGSFPVPERYVVGVVSNSTVSAFGWGFWIEHPEYRMILFNVSGADGFGFARMRIPNDFIIGPYSVTVDGAEPIYANCSVLTQGNNTWIYFSYLHSEHAVMVVPEFSALPLMPLLMGASLLAFAVCKRKRFRKN